MSESISIKELQDKVIHLEDELKRKEYIYDQQKKELLEAKEKAEESERMLHTLVETAVGTIGQDFFDNIVRKLAQWLDVDCVIIGQMLEPNRIHCLPLFLDGSISHEFSYELAGSPCDITTRKSFCCYNENVIDAFPKDQILVDLNAEGYVGTALYNKEGEANGVICAVSRKKFKIPHYTEKMLKIIGARVSAEIERKKIQEALKKSEAELRESNATKDKFISVIAHDLKNPFNSILGFSELLLMNIDEFSPEKQKKCINHIHQTAKHTYTLLENLLTWSLSKQGNISALVKKIKLKEVLTEDLELLRNVAQSKSINLFENISDEVFVMADKFMLSTIIRNLLSNSIKYSRNNTNIEVTSQQLTENNQSKIKVCIKDNGVGIAPENLDKLFRIDENISTPGTNNEKGTGMGLIICKEFIEKLGGEIYAESTLGKGSVFCFDLNSAS